PCEAGDNIYWRVAPSCDLESFRVQVRGGIEVALADCGTGEVAERDRDSHLPASRAVQIERFDRQFSGPLPAPGDEFDVGQTNERESHLATIVDSAQARDAFSERFGPIFEQARPCELGTEQAEPLS